MVHSDPANALLEVDFEEAFTSCPSPEKQRLNDALLRVRTEVVVEDQRMLRGEIATPEAKQPLDAGFLDLPERLLTEYRSQGSASELGCLLASAERLREHVDQVVLLGIGGSYMGPRALMEALCHPYHNERSRAARGGIPRMHFAGNNVDNDATAALLDLLKEDHGKSASGCDWGIVVVSKSGGTMETACALRVFLESLRNHCGQQPQRILDRLRIVTGPRGPLREMAEALHCPDVFDIPSGVGGRFSIFSAVGLLPAAILDIDVVQLLEGAAVMNKHFRDAEPGGNCVLDYVASNYWLENTGSLDIRVLNVWSDALEATGLWYDQLLAESLGKREQGATPLTVVNTRDLHSRAQQHQQGRRDKVHVNLVIRKTGNTPVRIGTSEFNQDGLDDLVGQEFPEIMAAAIAGTRQAYASDGRPTIEVKLPAVDACSLGQLFQMLMLATVVEGRLRGINPFGQPGVEAYKRNMVKILSRR